MQRKIITIKKKRCTGRWNSERKWTRWREYGKWLRMEYKWCRVTGQAYNDFQRSALTCDKLIVISFSHFSFNLILFCSLCHHPNAPVFSQFVPAFSFRQLVLYFISLSVHSLIRALFPSFWFTFYCRDKQWGTLCSMRSYESMFSNSFHSFVQPLWKSIRAVTTQLKNISGKLKKSQRTFI